MASKKSKLFSDSQEDYSTEGMIYGGAVGLVLLVFCTIAGHFSYGAVCVFVGVCVGLLFGMGKKKPKSKTEMDKQVEIYKNLDTKRNTFFPDMSVTPYNPTLRRPVLRTRIANGERMAGFINLRTGSFEEAMLISNDEDLKEFMRRYKIQSRDEIQEFN